MFIVKEKLLFPVKTSSTENLQRYQNRRRISATPLNVASNEECAAQPSVAELRRGFLNSVAESKQWVAQLLKIKHFSGIKFVDIYEGSQMAWAVFTINFIHK
ncbi:MAG: hypothetical protein SNJ66_11805 [Chloroherpetonaceae bacterium]